jgi:hypothetical protein
MMEWEVACANNPPMKQYILDTDRKIEAMLNVVVDDRAKNATKIRDMLSKQLYDLHNMSGVNSFIVGHAVGYVEAVEKYKRRTDEGAMSLATVMRRVLWVGVFAGAMVGAIAGRLVG